MKSIDLSNKEVYKVLIKENNKFVAIKFIFVLENKKINTSEINISNKLKHKNIINFYFCGEIKKEVLYCMVMDHGRFGHMFTFMNKYLVPYLSVKKGPIALSEDTGMSRELFSLNNEDYSYNPEKWARIYLNDGSSITMNIQNNSETSKQIICHIDINGDKKPNKIGNIMHYLL